MFKAMLKPELIDTRLTELGRNQCIQQQPLLNKFDLNTVVLCSPMRRTIETACCLLASHPKKEQLVIRLVPELKESLLSADTTVVTAVELGQFC